MSKKLKAVGTEELPAWMEKSTDGGPNWKCTDPDNQQYGRKLSERKFEFRQPGKVQDIIDLDDYTKEEIEDCINSYGYTSGMTTKPGELNIFDHYGEDANWIMAECLYEQDADLDIEE